MSDRHAEGIEKAAEAITRIVRKCGHGLCPVCRAESARAAVTAYLDHAFPEVDSAEGLDALPVGTAFLDRYGELTQVGESIGPDGRERRYRRILRPDAMASAVPLPARVIHWGGSA